MLDRNNLRVILWQIGLSDIQALQIMRLTFQIISVPLETHPFVVQQMSFD
jgi:hypothetical protein